MKPTTEQSSYKSWAVGTREQKQTSCTSICTTQCFTAAANGLNKHCWSIGKDAQSGLVLTATVVLLRAALAGRCCRVLDPTARVSTDSSSFCPQLLLVHYPSFTPTWLLLRLRRAACAADQVDCWPGPAEHQVQGPVNRLQRCLQAAKSGQQVGVWVATKEVTGTAQE